jgi:hypothetical protein
MTLNDAVEGRSARTTLLMQIGLMLLLAAAVAASLILALRHHDRIMLGVVLALGTVVVPAGPVLTRRTLAKRRQRETDDRLMLQTRTFLRSQEPARPGKRLTPESEIEILARAIDGRRMPLQGFRIYHGVAAPMPLADPVLFNALPRRYAAGSPWDRRLANLAAALPQPALLPLSRLLPAPAAQESGSAA